jgi:hypothetical protein
VYPSSIPPPFNLSLPSVLSLPCLYLSSFLSLLSLSPSPPLSSSIHFIYRLIRQCSELLKKKSAREAHRSKKSLSQSLVNDLMAYLQHWEEYMVQRCHGMRERVEAEVGGLRELVGKHIQWMEDGLKVCVLDNI